MRALWLLALFPVGLLIHATSASAGTAQTNPFIVLGVDGMEVSVIADLAAKGQMPNISALKARGVSTTLATDYGAASPVVWTTVATGMNKEVHGITNFEVATDDGTVPVSSTLRKVAAIWNMVSVANRKVLVLGWWGSWPAEAVNGRVVTDRATKSVPDRVSPRDWEAAFAADLKTASRTEFPRDDDAGAEDRMVQHFMKKGAAEGYDLIVGYIHGPDLVSHKYWKYYRPEGFPALDATKAKTYADMIPGKYRATDAVVGQVVAAMPKNTNFILISDHGFGPLPEEFVKVSLDIDAVLAKVGLLAKSGSNIDFSKTKVYNYGSAGFQMQKKLRYAMKGRENGGTVTTETKAAVKAEVAKVLAEVTYTSGKPVFALRDAKPHEVEKGADLVVDVLPAEPSKELRFRGQSLTGLVQDVVEHSGGHGWLPPGVFIAAGPDIDPKANLSGIRIHDITPTVLYGMGLPVAQDFNGKAYEQLYTSSFRAAHPKQTIASYGKAGSGQATESKQTDEEMLEQLRALGYIQ